MPAERRLVGLVPLQPYFPWSVVWPADSSAAVTAFVETARAVSADNGWLVVDRLPGTPWLPGDDFHRPRLDAYPPRQFGPAMDVSEIRAQVARSDQPGAHGCSVTDESK
jgi:hypothetical protein